jgi:sulfide:quinone oxidoreductase
VLDDGSELPYDLFLAVPKHRAPDVVLESGLAEDGYVPVESRTLRTKVPDVYAVGDVATVGVPKAGVFAEGAARTVGRAIIAGVRGGEGPPPYEGKGGCYIEFGGGLVGRVDVDFLSGPSPTGTLAGPSLEIAVEKRVFGSTRRVRWFGNPI